MNNTQIRHFMVLCDSLNFSAAARKLYISQPSISAQISSMEKELGVTLFFRNRRTTRLTPAGEHFYKGCKNLLAEYNKLMMETQFIAQNVVPKLSIGVQAHQRFGHTLAEIQSGLKESLPCIELCIKTADQKQLLAWLDDGTLDAILSTEFFAEQLSFALWHPTCRIKTQIGISHKHPLAGHKQIQLHQLKKETFLFLEQEETPLTRHMLQQACDHAGFEPIIQEVSSYQELVSTIEKGRGVFLLNSEHYMHSFPGIHVGFVEGLPDSTLLLVWDAKNQNPAVPVLSRFLSELAVQHTNF